MKRIAFLAASAVAVIVAVVAMFAASLTATPAPAAVAQSTPPPPQISRRGTPERRARSSLPGTPPPAPTATGWAG